MVVATSICFLPEPSLMQFLGTMKKCIHPSHVLSKIYHLQILSVRFLNRKNHNYFLYYLTILLCFLKMWDFFLEH